MRARAARVRQDEGIPAVGLRPHDAVAARAYLYILFSAGWKVIGGSVVDACTRHEAACSVRAGDERISETRYLYLSSGAELWTGYEVLPLEYGGLRVLEEDGLMSLEQLIDAEQAHDPTPDPTSSGTEFAEGEDVPGDSQD